MHLLSDAGLGVYAEKFRSLGTTLEQVLEMTPAELDALTLSVCMLKGHAVKFKKCIADAKKDTPDKRLKQHEVIQPPNKPNVPSLTPRKEHKPQRAPDTGIAQQLKTEVDRALAPLGNVADFKDALTAFKETVMKIDIIAHRRALEDIEALQRHYQAQDLEETTMEMES